MDFKVWKEQWLREEAIAHIRGWDFSHLRGRCEEEANMTWDYEAVVRRLLRDDWKLLDIDTGGGEFLLSLHHPCENISATEGYPPNVKLCREVLLPLGIDFRQAGDVENLPFPDSSFDMVINRHGDFCVGELYRILKPGGVFVTQQVGAENDRELVELLLPGTEMPFPEQYLKIAVRKFTDAGFEILETGEAFPKIRFYDVGAVVWFARIIEWEFPGFSVEDCFQNLCNVQDMLDETGVIEASTHRFFLVAGKPDIT